MNLKAQAKNAQHNILPLYNASEARRCGSLGFASPMRGKSLTYRKKMLRNFGLRPGCEVGTRRQV